jgi:hypothetical protein
LSQEFIVDARQIYDVRFKEVALGPIESRRGKCDAIACSNATVPFNTYL